MVQGVVTDNRKAVRRQHFREFSKFIGNGGLGRASPGAVVLFVVLNDAIVWRPEHARHRGVKRLVEDGALASILPIRTLSRRTGASERQVYREIAELKELGWIQVRVMGANQGRFSAYVLGYRDAVPHLLASRFEVVRLPVSHPETDGSVSLVGSFKPGETDGSVTAKLTDLSGPPCHIGRSISGSTTTDPPYRSTSVERDPLSPSPPAGDPSERSEEVPRPSPPTPAPRSARQLCSYRDLGRREEAPSEPATLRSLSGRQVTREELALLESVRAKREANELERVTAPEVLEVWRENYFREFGGDDLETRTMASRRRLVEVVRRRADQWANGELHMVHAFLKWACAWWKREREKKRPGGERFPASPHPKLSTLLESKGGGANFFFETFLADGRERAWLKPV